MRHLLLAVLLVAMTGCGPDTKSEEQSAAPANEDQPTVPAETAAPAEIPNGSDEPLSGPVSRPAVATQTKSALDVEALQGIWQIVTVERDGKIAKEAPEGRWKALIRTGEITELHWAWQGPDAPTGDSIYISDINSTTTPKAANVSHGGPGSFAAAIYALDGDGLNICIGNDEGGGVLGSRPKTFNTAPGDGRVLYVMKRVQNGQ